MLFIGIDFICSLKYFQWFVHFQRSHNIKVSFWRGGPFTVSCFLLTQDLICILGMQFEGNYFQVFFKLSGDSEPLVSGTKNIYRNPNWFLASADKVFLGVK